MRFSLRISPQTLCVLECFLQAPPEWRYGYEISRGTGLKSGTLYPILMRMADRSLLETRWEPAEPGKPPRHMYRLTASGVREARGILADATARGFQTPQHARKQRVPGAPPKQPVPEGGRA